MSDIPIQIANDSQQAAKADLAAKDAVAVALIKERKLAEAEAILKDVLESRLTHGDAMTNPDMIGTKARLASVFYHQNRFVEAESLEREMLEANEQIFGQEHPDTISTMHNLANVLTRLGKLDDALPLQRRALQLCQDVHGPDQPETLNAMNNLGDILIRKGKLDEAEATHRHVLKTRQNLRPNDHEAITTSMNNLAAVLGHQGKYAEAQQLYRDALALAQTDEEKLCMKGNLAKMLNEQEHYAEAEKLWKEVLALPDYLFAYDERTKEAIKRDLAELQTKVGKPAEDEAVLGKTSAAVA